MATALAISGVGGRMGRRIAALALADPRFELVQALVYPGHPHHLRPLRELDPTLDSDVPVTSNLESGADVLVDFSTPDGTIVRSGEVVGRRTALVVGTTGLTVGQQAAVNLAALTVPVLQTANFSLGVNVLLRVVADVARALGTDFDAEIVEAHHNRKADAPSGTALALAGALCAATGRDPERDLVHGRQGRPGPRAPGEIGMHALRIGSVVGDHTVHFGSDFERIELTHRVESRDVFAAGALRAALWLAGRAPGHYGMEQVLFTE